MAASARDILVSVFARTDTGMRRAGNEDAFLVADLTNGKVGLGPETSTHRIGDRGSLMVVSDGMGGAAAGEIASQMAVEALLEGVMDLPSEMDIGDRVLKAAELANERIWEYARQNPALAGMGATLTAVLVHAGSGYIGQVGDSRAYLIRGDRIKQLTKDQSLVQLLVDSGAIEADQATSVPQNVIMQALGTSPTVQVAMSVVHLYRGDELIICSDGLSNKVAPEEMRRVIAEAENPTAACRRLVEIANERGGEDNITVIVATFDGEGLDSAAESNSITGSFTILNQGCFERDSSIISGHFARPPVNLPTAESRTIVFEAIPPPESSLSPTHSTTGPEDVPGELPKPYSGRPSALFMVFVLVGLLLLAAAAYFGYRYLSRAGSTPQENSQSLHN